ncbi:albusnodin family lasso peptide [Streptomyces xiamenensis]|uniref:albusnodin family lasso peptide n=1 Tax=Streptomyces xiamenensis TaxID=408015 RepID=UPI0036E65AB8
MDTKTAQADEGTGSAAEEQLEVIDLGDVVGLTLGLGAGNSEDKRRAYNVA